MCEKMKNDLIASIGLSTVRRNQMLVDKYNNALDE